MKHEFIKFTRKDSFVQIDGQEILMSKHSQHRCTPTHPLIHSLMVRINHSSWSDDWRGGCLQDDSRTL